MTGSAVCAVWLCRLGVSHTALCHLLHVGAVFWCSGLTLQNNQLSGTFPLWDMRLTTMKLLKVGSNQHSGTIPERLLSRWNNDLAIDEYAGPVVEQLFGRVGTRMRVCLCV
jgi:hypothetical protein